MRVVIGDDSGIFRRGLRLLLEAAGHRVPADAGDVPSVLAAVGEHRPDACLLDVRMPPTFTDEGLRAAAEIRRAHPGVGVLVLSTYAEVAWADELLGDEGGVGYLLKDRVHDVAELTGALHRVAAGGTALDPEIVTSLVRRRRVADRLDALTDRERQVLELMARGLSNAGIGRELYVSPKTVETYAAAVFRKLGLDGGARDRNRRVLAVLAYLRRAA